MICLHDRVKCCKLLMFICGRCGIYTLSSCKTVGRHTLNHYTILTTRHSLLLSPLSPPTNRPGRRWCSTSTRLLRTTAVALRLERTLGTSMHPCRDHFTEAAVVAVEIASITAAAVVVVAAGSTIEVETGTICMQIVQWIGHCKCSVHTAILFATTATH